MLILLRQMLQRATAQRKLILQTALTVQTRLQKRTVQTARPRTAARALILRRTQRILQKRQLRRTKSEIKIETCCIVCIAKCFLKELRLYKVEKMIKEPAWGDRAGPLSIQSKILMKKAFRYKVRFQKMQVQQIEHVDNNYTGGQHEKDTSYCNRGNHCFQIYSRGAAPQISADELLEYIPEAREFCTIDTVQPFALDSTNVCADHWLKLARLIESKYEFYDGFVLCHGTDTMAYTAAALSYLIQNNRRPIVITGAQKPIDLAITDARSNLLDSLRFASHDRAHGISIVFGGKSDRRNQSKEGIFQKLQCLFQY